MRIAQKRLIGTVGLGVVLLILVGVFVWWRNKPPGYLDPLIPPAKTEGTIIALKETDQGETLVAIQADGAVRSPDDAGNVTECAWDAKGERVVFVSNRGPVETYQVYNWVPDRSNEPYRISSGAPVSGLSVHPSGRYVLVVSRGDVVAFSYPGGIARRVMPPSVEPVIGAEQELGMPGTAPDYQDVAQAISDQWRVVKTSVDGESFERGVLDRSGRYFAGILSTARGKALVLQDLEPEEPNQVPASVPLAAETMEIAIHPTDPIVAVSLHRFQYPSLAGIPRENVNPDGSVKKPYENALFLISFQTGAVPFFVSPDDSQRVSRPTFSPDGSQIAFLLIEKDGEQYVNRGLFVAPAQEGGIQAARRVADGNPQDPSWLPDGSGLLFVRDGDIYQVSVDGSGLKQITKDGGPYRSPQISPRRGR